VRPKKKGGEKMPKEKALTGKEKLFCFYCAEGRDARTAAAMAGFNVLPQRAAAKLLEREEISKEIAKRLGQNASGREEVCAGYRRLAFGSVADALRLVFSQEPLEAHELEALDLLNISDLKRPKGGGLEIKFFDRLKALEKLKELSEETARQEEGNPFFRALEKGAMALAQNRDDDEEGKEEE
jgi:hypothetical protein